MQLVSGISGDFGLSRLGGRHQGGKASIPDAVPSPGHTEAVLPILAGLEYLFVLSCASLRRRHSSVKELGTGRGF